MPFGCKSPGFPQGGGGHGLAVNTGSPPGPAENKFEKKKNGK